MVMCGMDEAASDVTARGSWDWDIRSCLNLFMALEVDLTEESIKSAGTVSWRDWPGGKYPRGCIL